MTETIIKLAYHTPTGKIIHVDKSENGKSCNCKCLKCNENLLAIQGDIRDNHFRHETDVLCNGSQETALHQLGKQILLENNQITIPKYGIIKYSDAVEEKEFSSIRPDITARFDDQNIYFEIAVNHFIEQEKKSFYVDGQHKCIEIDLSNADIVSHEGIQNLVLNEIKNKKLFGREQSEKSKQVAGNKYIYNILIGIGLFLISRWLFKRKRN